jgi:beta-mannosidase
MIPDEGIELNERKMQWVGEKDWLFKTGFKTPDDVKGYENVILAFDGLDTIATVTLNGHVVLECDNMFISYRVDFAASDLNRAGDENVLEIHFESAAKIARERMEASGLVWKAIREQSRVYVRKAQYHWGWDWGPSMITCGPWKDVRLEMYDSRIADVHADVKLDEACAKAEVDILVEMENTIKGLSLEGDISIDGTNLGSASSTVTPGQSLVRLRFDIDEPKLWWPAGHGEHPMHEATVHLKLEDAVLQTKTIQFGIRKVELVRRPLKSAEGETFFIRINNRPIFCVGTNWIPCHSLPAVAMPKLYEKNLKYAIENNNNMIRIWGGGIYEHDAFYEYCDRHGLMVWHDMMFACGIYPEDNEFHRSVTRELHGQIRRLRNHPSITLWNGDNEVFFM